jgi:hypothetical protein
MPTAEPVSVREYWIGVGVVVAAVTLNASLILGAVGSAWEYPVGVSGMLALSLFVAASGDGINRSLWKRLGLTFGGQA